MFVVDNDVHSHTYCDAGVLSLNFQEAKFRKLRYATAYTVLILPRFKLVVKLNNKEVDLSLFNTHVHVRT